MQPQMVWSALMQPLQDHEPEERGPDVYGVSKLADILEGKQSAIEFSLKGFIGIKLGKNGLAEGSVDTKSRGDIYVRAVETQKTVNRTPTAMDPKSGSQARSALVRRRRHE